MTFIKVLLFPLAVSVALLVPKYELRWLDGYWSATPGQVFSARDHGRGESGIAVDGYMCLLCSAAAPWADDESDDD